MKKIAILTNIDANHGSCIFNAALYRLIKNLNPENDVHLLDVLNPRWRLIELLRTLKPNRKIPFYNLQRQLTLARFTREEIPVITDLTFKSYESLCQDLISWQYDAFIVGKVMWDVSFDSPLRFPNIFWLSEEVPAVKIAYAISGHRTDLKTFRQQKERVLKILSSYRLIGVRDEMTQTMMAEAGVDRVTPVYRVSDPAFLYEPDPVDVDALLKRHGITPDRPLLGLQFYGKPDLSAKVYAHYHRKGYQVVNFSMFNPFADVNLGHVVTPDEWAALYARLAFCITDRFHGSVLCLSKGTPFVAIEPYAPKTLLNSKIYSLLQDFGIEDRCYCDPYLPGFDPEAFLSVCRQVEPAWPVEFSGPVRSRLQVQIQDQLAFLDLAGRQIGG